jgi:hypothetical protein
MVKYQSYFSFLVLMTTLTTNAKISNAELDEQLKLFVIFKCKSVIVVTKY